MAEVNKIGRRSVDRLLSPGQCRAARGFLGWSREDLAKAAGVSRAMIADFEGGKRDGLPATKNALQDALEAAGVEFPARSATKASIVFPNRDPGA